MLDVRRLEVLALAVREGSLAAAARALDITPSAASQAVAALEAQAGTPLLERLARGVRPTARGERLAAQAEAVLAILDRAHDELVASSAGTVTVAAFPTAVIGLLPAVLRRLAHDAPGLDVRVLELEPDAGRTAVRDGRADLALVNHHATLDPDRRGPWRVVHLRDEPVLLALPRDHRLAGRVAVPVERLRDDRWVMQQPASPCQDLVLRVCAAGGFAPTVAATCGDYRSILALVGAGAGVSLVPELALTGVDTSQVALVPTRPRVVRRVNGLVSGRASAAPGARVVMNALLAQEAGALAAAT
jgi:DNA-binding transcriptional LysR family regulator